jgi:hypothetical protein
MKIKSFEEWMNEDSSFITNLKPLDWSEPESEIKKLGKVFGKEVGVFTLSDNIYRYIYLPEDEISKGAFKNISLKDGEHIVRFVTLTSSSGFGQAPLIKINPSKGLVWFLQDYEADNEDLQFETKSKKVHHKMSFIDQ